MLIGILSDTHDRLPTFRRALEILRDRRVEVIFHAGDFVAPFAAKLLTPEAGLIRPGLPMHCIYGNNDGERAGLKKLLPQLVDGPLRVTLDLHDGQTCVVAMAHFLDWFKPEDLEGADLVISGHDHAARIETRPLTPAPAPGSGDGGGGKEVLFVNPGECCGWLTGRSTVAVVEASAGRLRGELIDVA